MIRFLFALSLALYCLPVLAQQDWWCVLPNTKNYYINGSNRLRGIRIDSLKSFGTTTVLYPFKSPRGIYRASRTVKPAGSWLGETITILDDGNHYFDNFWGDTVVVKTRAKLNDTWTFFSDTTSTYYTATITRLDTMTVLNTPDSIKEITLHAYDASGLLTNDTLNGSSLIISKHHGLVKACDFYIFPMHEPDTTYYKGFDFLLDASLNSYWVTRKNLFYTITDFYNPNLMEVYDFNVKDTFQWETEKGGSTTSIGSTGYMHDEITGKAIGSNDVEYEFLRRTEVTHKTYPPTTKVFSGLYKNNIQSKPLIDTTLMPEEWGQIKGFRYFPYDSSYCRKSHVYEISDQGVYTNGLLVFYLCGTTEVYKIGLGKPIHYECTDPTPGTQSWEKLVYVRKDGVSCGSYRAVSVPVSSGQEEISIYPNPATEQVRIQLPHGKHTVLLYNSIGILIKKVKATDAVTIGVNDLSSGIYIINIQTDKGEMITQKLAIQH